MIPSDRYTPILKARGAEYWALAGLKDASKDVVVPVFEVVPPSEKKTIHFRVKQTAERIYQCWQTRRFYVDMKWVSAHSSFYADKHVLQDFFNQADALALDAVPVTAFDRDPDYQRAAISIAKSHAKGLAIRISQEDMADPTTLSRSFDALLRLAGVEPEDVDLILDYGDVRVLAAGILAGVMSSTVAALPYPGRWRSLAAVGASFPPSLSEIEPDRWTKLARKEWIAWRSAATRAAGVGTFPGYGDYAIGAPDLSAGRRGQTANLRYSAAGDFFIWRGVPTKDTAELRGQILSICKDLVSRPEFAGDAFSLGDREIHERATTQGSPGEPKDWRAWATNHYFELVVSQLSSPPAP